MMDRLRSPMPPLAVTAFMIAALSFAGLGISHARASNASQAVHGNGPTCNALCETYLAWTHRVRAKFRPSRPLNNNVAYQRRPPRMMVHHAPKPRHSAMNSFAQWPVQGGAPPAPASTPQAVEAPQAAETPQAEVAPQSEAAAPRPVDQIADRFPAAREFLTAQLAGTDVATKDAAKDATDSPVAALADAFPAMRGTARVAAFAPSSDIRLVAALLLALASLTALKLWRRVGGRPA